MPIYDYTCTCGDKKGDEFVTYYDAKVRCDKCGSIMERQFPLQFVPAMFPKDGIHLKHVCPGGKTFSSKTEMKRYAIKHNLELGALL